MPRTRDLAIFVPTTTTTTTTTTTDRQTDCFTPCACTRGNYSPPATPLNGVHVLASGATIREKAIKGLVKLLTKADGEKQLGIELRTNLFIILVCSSTMKVFVAALE